MTDILGKPLGDLQIAHVISASKGAGVGSLDYLDRTRAIFKQKGCAFEDLDLDGMTENQLRLELPKFDAVFVNGGSTFYLLKSIRESGFDKVIADFILTGRIYIGASAGSYVACPTIEMATWKHQDKYDRCGLTDLSAMNLVPFLVTAHYVPEYRDILKDKIAHAAYPTKILSDEHAVLIRDGKATVLGGDEINL
jgi:dipeptidase E